MGPSRKWVKSLLRLKAAAAAGGKERKWTRLWRSASSGSRTGDGDGALVASEASSGSMAGDGESGALASSASFGSAVARASRRGFRLWGLIVQDWAAERIQIAFRAFLARRALKALRGVVRLQALLRGRLVRRQLAVTAKRTNAVAERNRRANASKDAEEQWCNCQGSVDEIRSKLHMRHEGAAKRKRAIAYDLSRQPRSSKHSGKPSSPASCLRSHEPNRCNHNLSYLEGWMAIKPWEIRFMEQSNAGVQFANNSEGLSLAVSKLSDASSVKIRRNNVKTRVTAKPPSAVSASSSDFACDESSPSSSSVTPMPTPNILASEARVDSGHIGEQNHKSFTKSTKARLNGYNSHRGSFQIQRQRSRDMSRAPLSSINTQRNAGSEISVTSKRLNSMSLKGRSITRSLDKENDD
ncbi:hypothetical protein ACP70R_023039 [Stipagrostis hirtigluma subsp. patula]